MVDEQRRLMHYYHYANNENKFFFGYQENVLLISLYVTITLCVDD